MKYINLTLAIISLILAGIFAFQDDYARACWNLMWAILNWGAYIFALYVEGEK